MSVLTVLVRPDNFALMGCDGVATDPATGAVAGFMQKIRTYPAMSCAVGITGLGGFDALMDCFLPIWVKDFDDLIDVLPAVVKAVFAYLEIQGQLPADTRCSVCAAGWSPRASAFKAFRLVSYPKKSRDAATGELVTLEPWVAHELAHSGTWSSAGARPEDLARCGVNSSPGDDAANAVRIIAAARQSSGKIEAEEMPGTFNAGGFVQLALIERGKVTSWVPHTWPEDVIGEPIDPTRGVLVPEFSGDSVGT